MECTYLVNKRTRIHVHARTHARTHARARAHTHARTRMHARTYACTHTYRLCAGGKGAETAAGRTSALFTQPRSRHLGAVGRGGFFLFFILFSLLNLFFLLLTFLNLDPGPGTWELKTESVCVCLCV